MPGIVGDSGVPAFLRFEDLDGNMFVQAKFFNATATKTVSAGDVGVVEFANGGYQFVDQGDIDAVPRWQIPAVAQGSGGVGDVIVCQVYGEASATFAAAIDTRTNKNIQVANAGITVQAAGVDNLRWGRVVGAGANSATQTVFLSGVVLVT